MSDADIKSFFEIKIFPKLAKQLVSIIKINPHLMYGNIITDEFEDDWYKVTDKFDDAEATYLLKNSKMLSFDALFDLFKELIIENGLDDWFDTEELGPYFDHAAKYKDDECLKEFYRIIYNGVRRMS